MHFKITIKTLLSTFLCFIFSLIYAQTDNVAINNDGFLPDASAILDVKSINKGMTFPRMTTAQRNTISDPTTGLIIYNMDTDCIEYFAGLLWIELCGDVAPNNIYPSGIYVSLLGDDNTGDGSPKNPYKTVVKGIEEMENQNEDTLRITVGSYSEATIEILQDTGSVIIGGYDEFTWILNGQGNTEIFMNGNTTFSIRNSDNLKIEHMSITGSPGSTLSTTSSYGLRILESTNISIDNSEITARNGIGGALVGGVNGANGSEGFNGNGGHHGSTSSNQPRGGFGGNPGGGKGGDGVRGTTGNDGAAGGAGGSGDYGENGNNGFIGGVGIGGVNGQGGLSFGGAGLIYQT